MLGDFSADLEDKSSEAFREKQTLIIDVVSLLPSAK